CSGKRYTPEGGKTLGSWKPAATSVRTTYTVRITGTTGISTPTEASRSVDHAPAQTTTASAPRCDPSAILTPVTRSPATVSPVTSACSKRAPPASARRRYPVVTALGSTEPSSGPNVPPTNRSQ